MNDAEETGTVTPSGPDEVTEMVNNASVDSDATDSEKQNYSDALDYFMSDEEVDLEEDADVRRVNPETGKDEVVMTLRLRAITDQQLTRIRKRVQPKQGGRGRHAGNNQQDVDETKFYLLLILESCVAPNLPEVATRAGHPHAEMMLRKKLLPGEITALGMYVLDMSGFGDSVTPSKQKEVDAAKN